MNVKIIGFSGKMGSGKSSAIKCLEDLGYITHLIKFAGPLYDMQESIYTRISSVFKRPSDFKKDRKLLQWLGTNWGRSIDENLWVSLWKAEAEKALPFLGEFDVIVCDDVRFDNEAETITALGGKVIHIERPDSVSHAEGGEGIVQHASEAGINPKFLDCGLVNSGSIDELRAQLSCVLSLFDVT